jgi:hypothetical protein
MHSATIPLAAIATFAAVYWLAPAPAAVAQAEPGGIVETAAPVSARPVGPAPEAPEAPVYFAGCNEVRAAGLAPLFRGQPGYRSGMDGDDDGIACEPYRGGY